MPAKTAAKVDAIMDAYKTEMKAMTAKPGDPAIVRLKVDSLITAKNQKLSAILTPAQLSKIVPPTEQKQTVKAKVKS